MILVLAIGSTGASAEDFRPDNEDLYFAATNENATKTLNTVTVSRGLFVMKSACKATISYNKSSYITSDVDGSSVKFVEFLVSNGTKVKRGDLIAAVQVSIEKEDVSQLDSKIALAEANLDSYIAVNKELLDKYMNRWQNGASYADRRTGELLYKRLKASFDEEKEARQKSIEDLYNRYYNNLDSDIRYILSDRDGTVSNLNRLRNGDNAGRGTFICMIYDTSDVTLRINGGNDYFRYNMPVLITQKVGNGTLSVNGRVTTCRSKALSPSIIGSNDMIEVYGDCSDFTIGEEVTVTFEAIRMEDALIVDKRAVGSDKNGSFVYVLSNGIGVKRYILAGGQNPTEVWVLQGLEEGDQLVINN